jgi:hypothetical protein
MKRFLTLALTPYKNTIIYTGDSSRGWKIASIRRIMILGRAITSILVRVSRLHHEFIGLLAACHHVVTLKIYASIKR